MRRIALLQGMLAIAIAMLAALSGATAVAQSPPTVAFTNGQWFNGHSFEEKTGYAVDGRLTFHRPRNIDRRIDLHQGFVVPPFGEAHNHNVEMLNKVDVLIATYLRHGIFYVKNPNNLARDRDALATKVNRPDSIDVSFSNGSLTATGGHPLEIAERVVRSKKWTKADAEGGFYYTVADEAELVKKWPALIATHPDFIKTYLLYSDQYAHRRNDPKFYAWKGLDPALLSAIVKKAHASGLRVSTHIENAADFRNALAAGVDEINHMPGFRYGADVVKHPASEFELTDADAQRAAKQGTFVVTTLAGSAKNDDPEIQRLQEEINRKNLALLLKHHVKLALGSDSYRADTLPEALYLGSLHVMDNVQLLNLWCTSTVATIFPGRKVGRLKEGYEASFLVLGANPIGDFSAVEQIKLEVKQGGVLDTPP